MLGCRGYNIGMKSKSKTAKQMERHFKGIANHYRIEILLLVAGEENITVESIAKRLGANFKTISQHTRYLVQAGLIDKRYRRRMVEHSLSPYGKIFARFVASFQSVGG